MVLFQFLINLVFEVLQFHALFVCELPLQSRHLQASSSREQKGPCSKPLAWLIRSYLSSTNGNIFFQSNMLVNYI